MPSHYDLIIIGTSLSCQTLAYKLVPLGEKDFVSRTQWLVVNVGKRSEEPGAPGSTFLSALAA